MPKITRLSAQKKDPNRVNIEVDGQFVTGLSLEEVVKLRLVVGQDVAVDTLSKWKALDDKGKILGKVINFLSYRPRTQKEVELRLKTYSLDPLIRDYVMDYLKNHEILDDLAFATWWVSSRSTKFSARVLRQELQVKGISKDIISSVLSLKDDTASLQELIAKKQSRYNDKAKLYRYCLSKGYSYDLISEALSQMGKDVLN